MFAAFTESGLWPGLGRTTAAALPAAGVLRPDDVTATALRRVPKMLNSRAERLVTTFAAAAEAYDVVALLVPAGLAARLAGPAVRVLGAGAVTAAAALQADPWRLLELPEVRAAEADRLARALLPGVQPDDARRGRALVPHVLVRAARGGSTCLPVDDVAQAVRELGVRDPAAAVQAATQSGRVRVADGLAALPRYDAAERGVAAGVRRLLATAEPLADPAAGGAAAVGAAAGGAAAGGAAAGGAVAGGAAAGGAAGTGPDEAQLDEAQREAVAGALAHGVHVLTGGPGTGKSRTVATLVALATARGHEVALAAPTGRAAKRLEELCQAPATTLHRLLGAQGAGGGFERGADWPLDEDVVVVDEASMLDVELAAALLDACPDGCHLLLVGDPAQLPSIGPGRVLGDVLDSDAVPSTELRTLYRQADGGAIARLATAVRGGELPAPQPDADSHTDRDDGLEVVVVPARGAAQAAHRTVQLVCDSIPRALGIAPEDVQVVTPVHRGPAGTVALNAALKARLNPGSGGSGAFDVGDRVVATANHLDEGFANGEVGTVTAVRARTLVVAFPTTGPVDVSPAAASDLVHGWALTVHRAQGSEFAAVVAVLPPEAGGLLSRPLVYTAFTRAQRHLSVVHAAGPALARAVREIGAVPRRTRLAALLRSGR